MESQDQADLVPFDEACGVRLAKVAREAEVLAGAFLAGSFFLPLPAAEAFFAKISPFPRSPNAASANSPICVAD